MANITIPDGVTSTGLIINAGDNLYIQSGGTATNTTENGGNVEIKAGGVADFATNTITGQTIGNTIMTVHKNTVANENVFGAGGSLKVYDGGIASGNMLNVGAGNVDVYSGGKIYGTTANVGEGHFTVSSGGYAENTVFTCHWRWGSGLTVLAGATITGTTVYGDGRMFINEGAAANNTLQAGGGVNASGILSVYTATGGTLSLNAGADAKDINLTNATMNVNDGAVASGLVVTSRATVNVNSGGVVDGLTEVGLYNTVNIASEGSATKIKETGGAVYVTEGGIVDFEESLITGQTVDNYAMTVHKNTVANENVFGAGGSLKVYDGGIASGNMLNVGAGNVDVYSGGKIYGTTANVGEGHFTVSSGGYAENTVFTCHWRWGSGLTVLTGATITGTTVYGDGRMFINEGAAANNTLQVAGTVTAAGTLSVYTATGGTLNLNAGADAKDINLTNATMNVNDGAVASGLVVTSRATVNVNSGGVVDGLTEVGLYNTVNIASEGSATKIKETGGAVYVTEGGIVDFEESLITGQTVNNYAMTVHRNTVANENVFGAGGSLKVYDGGIASGNMLNVGAGNVDVYSGGKIYGTTANVGEGHFTVSSGGYAENTVFTCHWRWGSGLTVLTGATITGTTVYGDGRMYVSSGGLAEDTLMVGGTLNLVGGTVTDIVFSGGGAVISSGVLTGRVSIENGNVNIGESGTFLIDLTEVAPRTAAIVKGINRVTGTKVITVRISDTQAAGKYLLSSDADGFNGTISVVNDAGEELGTLTVDGSATIGGTDCHLVVSRHTLKFFYGIDVIPSDVYVDAQWIDEEPGTTVTVNGGTATVGFDAFATGAAAAAAVDEDDGILYIQSGTTVSFPGFSREVIVSSGAGLDVPSGSVTGIATIQTGGAATVFEGGSATMTAVSSGGELNVYGGSLATAIVTGGGRMTVTDGAKVQSLTAASNSLLTFVITPETEITGTVGEDAFAVGGGAAMNCRVNASCTLEIAGGATAYDTVASGTSALVRALDGGTAVRTTVVAGATAGAAAGGTLSSVNLESGSTLELASGGKLSGRTALVAGAAYRIEDGAIVDFDISALTTPSIDLLINDLSLLSGELEFTLTVSGTQDCGTYYFAGGATGFDKTVSVISSGGDTLGMLQVDETVKIGEAYYTLRLTDGLLGVTIAEPDTVTPRRGDRDGNGISDVMFVWTGNNYSHGYWMNGKDEWWSAFAPYVASDWDNLGSYDMDGDGCADAVMFGNVTTEIGGKGAYIGFYRAGDDVSGWQHIGYLSNAEDIAWQNKVGNLTGNSDGRNSIVWYSPERSLLGFWKDGTDEWVGLSLEFGGDEWKLVGCGDFDGTGRDSVLMSQNDGESFSSVDSNGVTHQLGSLNWSGWELRAIGDFAGDGRDDIVLFYKPTGSMVMLADGNTDDWTSIGQLDAGDWFVVGAGDYNGDEKDDLLVRQYSTGMLGYYVCADQGKWVEMGRGVGTEWTVIA